MRRFVLEEDAELALHPIVDRMPSGSVEALVAAATAACGIEALYLAEFRVRRGGQGRGLLLCAVARGAPDAVAERLLAEVERRLDRTDAFRLIVREAPDSLVETLEQLGACIVRAQTRGEGAMAALIGAHVLASMDKQDRLIELVGADHEWSFDLDQGQLTLSTGTLFKKRRRFACQVLAVTHDAGTWEWGWAAPPQLVPPKLARASLALKSRLERDGAVELTRPRIEIDGPDAMLLALVSVGALGAHFSYLVPIEGGELVLVCADSSYAMTAHDPFARFCTYAPVAIGIVPLPDHRDALVGYARWLGLRTSEGHDRALVVDGGGAAATLRFDPMRRLSQLEA